MCKDDTDAAATAQPCPTLSPHPPEWVDGKKLQYFVNQWINSRPEITLFQPTWFHSIPLCEPPWPAGRLSGFVGFSSLSLTKSHKTIYLRVHSLAQISTSGGSSFDELRLERGRMAFLLEECGTRTSLVQWWGPLTKPSLETRHCICPSYFATYRSSHIFTFNLFLYWVHLIGPLSTCDKQLLSYVFLRRAGDRHLLQQASRAVTQWMLQGVALVYCGASLQISRSLNSKLHKVSF